MNDLFCSSCTKPLIENIAPTLPIITGAAFVDSINPCAIAVLLILLTALLATKNKQKTLKAGLAFILGLFITYFLLGIGLVGVLNLFAAARIFHLIIGALAIIVGIFNVKDFFWYGGAGFVMEIPRSWRPFLQKMLKSITSPIGAFLIGFVVTLFELPCTGGPYIFVLGLLSQNLAWAKIIPILLYYNFIFVLPLILITVLIYFGFSTTEKATAWKDRNIRLLHLIAGIIMITLGIWVLLY